MFWGTILLPVAIVWCRVPQVIGSYNIYPRAGVPGLFFASFFGSKERRSPVGRDPMSWSCGELTGSWIKFRMTWEWKAKDAGAGSYFQEGLLLLWQRWGLGVRFLEVVEWGHGWCCFTAGRYADYFGVLCRAVGIAKQSSPQLKSRL